MPAVRLLSLLVLTLMSPTLVGQEVGAAPLGNRSAESRDTEKLAIELRVVWGGGPARTFQGSIKLDRGSLQLVQNLSLQTDAVGTLSQADRQSIVLAGHSPTTFGGVDLMIEGSINSRLTITFDAVDNGRPTEVNCTLGELLQGHWVRSVDNQGTRVAAERQVFDRLRIRSTQPNNLFPINARWIGVVEGYRCGLPPGDYTLQYSLVDAETNSIVTKGDEKNITLDDLGSFPTMQVELPLPDTEGTWLVDVSIARKRFLSSLVGHGAALNAKLELVTLDYNTNANRIASWEKDATIDPLSSQWWTKLGWIASLNGGKPLVQIPGVADLVKRPVSHGTQSTRTVGQAHYLSLGPGAWQAYPLSIDNVGLPHRLKIRVPMDRPQKMVVSIRDYNAQGDPTPLNVDSGLVIGRRTLLQEDDDPNSEQFTEHEIIFWPRSAQPYVMLLNADNQQDAAFGTIQLEIGLMSNQPEKPSQPSPTANRQVALYLTKPLLVDAFGAQRTIDSVTKRTLESWRTWQQVASRLTQYMHEAGYNTLVLNILSDGGAITEIPNVLTNTRFDSGVFFGDGRSPHTKDIVELLCFHLDRANLNLILSLEIDHRMPVLENLETQGEGSHGLFQVNLDGAAWQPEGQSLTRRRLYNPLHKGFQGHLDLMIRELCQRYASHRCFAGLAFELNEYSHLTFAGDRWGYDSQTLQQYQSANKAKLNGDRLSDTMRGAIRLSYVNWRARALSEFYVQLADTIAKAKPGARLLLNPLSLLQRTPSEVDFMDPRAMARNPNDILVAAGIDAAWLKQHSHIAVVRGRIDNPTKQRLEPGWMSRFITEASQSNASASNAAAVLQRTTPVAISEPAKLAGGGNAGWIYPMLSEPTLGRRKRLIEQLHREDATLLADGGWMHVQGELDELQQLRKSLSELPNVPMQAVGIDGGDSNLVVRSVMVANDTYLQLINNSPWVDQVTMDVQVAGANGLVEVLGDQTLKLAGSPVQLTNSTSRNGLNAGPLNSGASNTATSRAVASRKSTTWQFEMQPYQLLAIRVSDPQFRLNSVLHSTSSEVFTLLKQHIEGLENDLAQVSNNDRRRWLGLKGGDFEQWSGGIPSGWTKSMLSEVHIAMETALPHTGRHCLMLENRSQSKLSAWLQSDNIDIPDSGRMAVEAWVRSSALESTAQTVRLSVKGRTRDGRTFQRSQEFGAQSGNQELSSDWGKRPLTLNVSDVPSDDLISLQVEFDLVGPGKVWVDDIQAYETYLTPDERVQVRSQLFLAKEKLEKDNPFAAEQAVHSPWARHLNAIVSLNATRVPAMDATRPAGLFNKPEADIEPSKSPSNAADPTTTSNEVVNPTRNGSPPIFKQFRESMRERWIR